MNKKQSRIRPKYIGMLTRDGWLGHLPFFRNTCKKCGEVYDDYPHGYDNHIFCPKCGERDYV